MAQWKPPRGIRIYKRAGRKKAFYVAWYVAELGRYESQAFLTQAEQLGFARALAENREGPPIDFAKWRRWCEFERTIGGIENLEAVERLYASRGVASRKLLAEAVDEFCRDKGFEGVDFGTVRRYQRYLGGLVKTFPGVCLADLHEDDLSGWLQGLTHNRKPVAALTRDNYRKFAGTFFRWCRLKRYLAEDPMERVPRVRVTADEVLILTIDEGQKLFAANRHEPVIGRLALEAFAGLRYTTARDLALSDINFDERGLSLPAMKVKTRKRFYVDGFPKTVWNWLAVADERGWELKPRQYQEAKRHAFIRAGVPHPHNCLRHSFATYHVAAFGDVGKTATLLCHGSLAMLNRNYRGVATKREGLAWFGINP